LNKRSWRWQKKKGSNFAIDGDARVVSFFQKQDGEAAEDRKYSIMMPFEHRTQYYHVYSHSERRMVIALAAVEAILEWVQRSSHKGIEELELSRQVEEKAPANDWPRIPTGEPASSWDASLRRWISNDGPAACFLSFMAGEIGPVDEAKEFKALEIQTATYFLWVTTPETDNASQLSTDMPSSADTD